MNIARGISEWNFTRAYFKKYGMRAVWIKVHFCWFRALWGHPPHTNGCFWIYYIGCYLPHIWKSRLIKLHPFHGHWSTLHFQNLLENRKSVMVSGYQQQSGGNSAIPLLLLKRSLCIAVTKKNKKYTINKFLATGYISP